MDTQTLTLENFKEQTGHRFRPSREVHAKIKSGEITREAAFQEFLDNGGLEKLKAKSRPEIPDSVYLTPGLTLDNFSEVVKQAIGVSRRFRVSRESKKLMDEGSLTREGALQLEIEKRKKV